MSQRLAAARATAPLCLALAALGALAAPPLAACNHDTDLGIRSDSGAPEASLPDAMSSGTGITVTARAPALTSAPGEKVSATWAAYRLDEGEWRTVMPSAAGVYTFAVPTTAWAIALVCASDDGALSTVFVHRRPASTRSLDVALEAQCTPEPPPAEFALAGTIRNLPATTQWLDFGYARDTRGSVLPVAGGKASYEVVGVAPGTWDLGFGVRDDSFGALTRMLLLRDTVIGSDRNIDIDATGAAAFAPETKRLVLRGLDARETVRPQVVYAAGGPHGLDVGPQDVPVDTRDVTLAYSTVPDAIQRAGDRYRGAIAADRDRREALRGVVFSVHSAIDIDLSLPPMAAKPVVSVLQTSPQVRLETRFAALAHASRHEVRVLVENNRRTQHVWHATFDAALVAESGEVVDAMPDLSSLAGWRSEWALPVGVTATVVVTTYEAPEALGDGTMQRATGNSAVITP